MKKYIIITISIFLLYSCSDSQKNNQMPEIYDCDSATIMYYKTPGNPRFFFMTKVRDMDSVAAITKDVNGKLITVKDSCITQGKIFFYGKGDAVYPVYFSTDADCMTLSFIKTGEKYFTTMSDAGKKILDSYQLTAKEPGSE